MIKKILKFIFYPLIWIFKKIFKPKKKRIEYYAQDVETLRSLNLHIRSLTLSYNGAEGLKYSLIADENNNKRNKKMEEAEKEASREEEEERKEAAKEAAESKEVERERESTEKKKRGRPKKKKASEE